MNRPWCCSLSRWYYGLLPHGSCMGLGNGPVCLDRPSQSPCVCQYCFGPCSKFLNNVVQANCVWTSILFNALIIHIPCQHSSHTANWPVMSCLQCRVCNVMFDSQHFPVYIHKWLNQHHNDPANKVHPYPCCSDMTPHLVPQNFHPPC